MLELKLKRFAKKQNDKPTADKKTNDEKFLEAIKETRSLTIDELAMVYGGNDPSNNTSY